MWRPRKRLQRGAGTSFQTYGSILTLILHSNDVPCCWSQLYRDFRLGLMTASQHPAFAAVNLYVSRSGD